jgi:hypothetical protein
MACIFASFYAYSKIQQGFYTEMKKNVEVLFTATEFRVNVKGHWQIYDRTLTHRLS